MEVELIPYRVQQATTVEQTRRNRSSLGRGQGEILKLNSPGKNKIRMWNRLKYSSGDLCL